MAEKEVFDSMNTSVGGGILPSRTFNVLWSLSIVVVAVTCLVLVQQWVFSKRLRLPPGPSGWPIIGSLLELEPLVHRAFAKMAQQYGPIMHLRLGVWDTVVISSVKEAEELFKTRDREFASRPHSTIARLATKYIGFDGQDIIFQSYNSNVKNLRKVCTMEVLSTTLNEFIKLRAEEVGRLIQTVSGIAEQGGSVKLRDHLLNMTHNMMTELLFGKRLFGTDVALDPELQAFREVVQDMVVAVTTMNIADLIPALEWLDPAGMMPLYKSIEGRLLKLFGRILEEHRAEKAMLAKTKTTKKLKDFCDVLLDYEGENKEKLSDTVVMAVLMDMLGAGTDNTASSVEWALARLIRHPSVLQRLQQEIDEVVGTSRAVSESDVRNMPFLDAVIKESYRLHTPVPLLLPRMNEEATTLGGYDIPKKSTLYVNCWAMGRDPSVWDNPEVFDPDRFLRDDKISMMGTSFELLPFGSGRRNCVGLKLGLLMVQLTVASMVHAFDWSPAPGVKAEDVSITEEFGFVLRMAVPMVATPRARATAKYYNPRT